MNVPVDVGSHELSWQFVELCEAAGVASTNADVAVLFNRFRDTWNRAGRGPVRELNADVVRKWRRNKPANPHAEALLALVVPVLRAYGLTPAGVDDVTRWSYRRLLAAAADPDLGGTEPPPDDTALVAAGDYRAAELARHRFIDDGGQLLDRVCNHLVLAVPVQQNARGVPTGSVLSLPLFKGEQLYAESRARLESCRQAATDLLDGPGLPPGSRLQDEHCPALDDYLVALAALVMATWPAGDPVNRLPWHPPQAHATPSGCPAGACGCVQELWQKAQSLRSAAERAARALVEARAPRAATEGATPALVGPPSDRSAAPAVPGQEEVQQAARQAIHHRAAEQACGDFLQSTALLLRGLCNHNALQVQHVLDLTDPDRHWKDVRKEAGRELYRMIHAAGVLLDEPGLPGGADHPEERLTAVWQYFQAVQALAVATWPPGEPDRDSMMPWHDDVAHEHGCPVAGRSDLPWNECLQELWHAADDLTHPAVAAAFALRDARRPAQG